MIVRKLLFGADPELTIYKNNELVRASSHFSSTNAKIGRDAAGTPLEFRPTPADDPAKLVKEIGACMKKVVKRGFELSVQGDDVAIGCHIHISDQSECLTEYYNDAHWGSLTPYGMNVALVMDEWLGKPFQILNGSARGSYNMVLDKGRNPEVIRTKSYGGFEYRCLPSAVMFSPKTLLFVFKVAQWAINHMDEKSVKDYTFANHEDWMQRLKEVSELKTSGVLIAGKNFPNCTSTSANNRVKQAIIKALEMEGENYTIETVMSLSGDSYHKVASSIQAWHRMGYSLSFREDRRTSMIKEVLNLFRLRKANPSALRGKMLHENWNLPVIDPLAVPEPPVVRPERPPRPIDNRCTFSNNDDWSAFPRQQVRAMSEFNGIHFIGLNENRGEVIAHTGDICFPPIEVARMLRPALTVIDWSGEMTIGIPRIWRDGRVALDQVFEVMRLWSVRIREAREGRQ